MNEENIKQLLADGLLTLKAGARVAADGADEIMESATDPELKSMLETGNETAKEWRNRIDQALGETGASGEGEDPVAEAHLDVARRIRENAPDDQSRDLGIIAAGQQLLHYWIASFGTAKAYASSLGLDRTAQEMDKSLSEAKQIDEQHTQLATQIMG